MATHSKRIRSSEKYKYVALYMTAAGKERWKANFERGAGRTSKVYDTEREAAMAIDMRLIEDGMEPINILKRKV